MVVGSSSSVPASGLSVELTTERMKSFPWSENAKFIHDGAMMELVDIADLKSAGPQGPCGFESRSRYYETNK